MNKNTIIVITCCLLCAANALRAASLLVEAESFQRKGGWVVDQQFMDLMGSPYLLAHGMGKPVADAATTARLPADGVYHVYVRTYNWTSPWHEGEGPGRFSLLVNGKTLSSRLGVTGNRWEWQYAGKFRAVRQEVRIALHDLSGFDGRCDAIYFTTDENDIPPSDLAALEAFRRSKLGLGTPAVVEGYDLVVAGSRHCRHECRCLCRPLRMPGGTAQ